MAKKAVSPVAPVVAPVVAPAPASTLAPCLVAVAAAAKDLGAKIGEGADAVAKAAGQAEKKVVPAMIAYVDALVLAGVRRDAAGIAFVKENLREATEQPKLPKGATEEQKTAAKKRMSYIKQARIRAVKLWFYLDSNEALFEGFKKGKILSSILGSLPTPDAAAGGAPASSEAASTATTVSRADLDKVIADAIAKAKALSLGGFAAEIEKLVKEHLSK